MLDISNLVNSVAPKFIKYHPNGDMVGLKHFLSVKSTKIKIENGFSYGWTNLLISTIKLFLDRDTKKTFVGVLCSNINTLVRKCYNHSQII